jgi:hypothetical protein
MSFAIAEDSTRINTEIPESHSSQNGGSERNIMNC